MSKPFDPLEQVRAMIENIPPEHLNLVRKIRSLRFSDAPIPADFVSSINLDAGIIYALYEELWALSKKYSQSDDLLRELRSILQGLSPEDLELARKTHVSRTTGRGDFARLPVRLIIDVATISDLCEELSASRKKLAEIT